MKISLLKEVFTQLLFPRVCPVCGELLTLPSARQKQSIDVYLSGMICKNCRNRLNFLSGPCCAKCSKPLTSEEEIFCDFCRKKKRFFDSGSALLLHDETAKKLIYGLKFRNKRDNAELLGFLMALQFQEVLTLWKADALIPVPLHKKRLRERGFNQAELIAETFSFWLKKLYGLDLPVLSDFLLRSKNTKPQRTLEAGMREGNVGNAFVISPAAPALPLRSVVLIDDIFTSGSTISACAETLKKAGIRYVHFLTASIV